MQNAITSKKIKDWLWIKIVSSFIEKSGIIINKKAGETLGTEKKGLNGKESTPSKLGGKYIRS